MKGFIHFIQERGVIGFATGFIVGGAVSKLVTAFVTDIIDPVLSILLGATGNLKEAKLIIGPVIILWGDFIVALIDFLVLAFVVYFLFFILRLEKLDKKKE